MKDLTFNISETSQITGLSIEKINKLVNFRLDYIFIKIVY